MQILTEQEIIDQLSRGKTLAATVDTGAFTITIEQYVPTICTAIHDGHHVPSQVAEQMLVTPQQRKFEEDPFTGELIGSFPITLRVHDSRYFYDLNRRPEACIYEEAWGRQVWRLRPDAAQRRLIVQRHSSYYRVLQALIAALEKRFSRIVIYDLHSYNFARLPGEPPLFNIGTHFIDRLQFEPVLAHLCRQLQALKLPQLSVRCACDEVFFGEGYQAEFVRSRHPGSLCLPLEVKKVFMDEQAAEIDPLLFEAVRTGIEQAISCNAAYFATKMSTGHIHSTAFCPTQEG